MVKSNNKLKNQGFTLIEIAAVILIFGAITAATVVLGGAWIKKETFDSAKLQMKTVEMAMETYRKLNDRLPCPADFNLPPSDDNYGREADKMGECSGSTPAAQTVGDSKVVFGAVPAKTLGMADSMLVDPWGNRYVYYVDRRMTENNAFDTYAIDNKEIGEIVINKRGNPPTTRTQKAVYALLSHGANGRHAFRKNGVRDDTDSPDAGEQDNYNYDPTSSANDRQLVQGFVDEEFDDIVVFKLRRQMLNLWSKGSEQECPADTRKWPDETNGPCRGSVGTLDSGDKVQVVDNQEADTGSIDVSCKDGALDYSNAVCGAGACDNTNFTWSKSGQNCTAAHGKIYIGMRADVEDSIDGGTGTGKATIKCTGVNTYEVINGECGGGCAANSSLTWNDGSYTCQGATPAMSNNDNMQVLDSTPSDMGYASFTCIDGKVIQDGVHSCGPVCHGIDWRVLVDGKQNTCSNSSITLNNLQNVTSVSTLPADDNSGTAINVTCNGGQPSIVGPNTCNIKNCKTTHLDWTEGTYKCGATIKNMEITDPLETLTDGNRGSATYLCVNGAYVEQSATCHAEGADSIATPSTAWSWGANHNGSLGDGTASSKLSPVLVQTNKKFIQVSAGEPHSCAVDGSNTVWCWGKNNKGQLGIGSAGADHSTPQEIPGLSFKQVVAGEEFSCGLTIAGKAYCWGEGDNGRLGTGNTTDSSVPVAVQSTAVFESIDATFHSVCALKADGEAWCWGDGVQRGDGDNTFTDTSSPVKVGGTHVFTQISVGENHSCALDDANDVWCWGEYQWYRLGVNVGSGQSLPVKVTGGYKFQKIAAGHRYSCGLTTSGQVMCWGDSGWATPAVLLGDGSASARLPSTPVTGGHTFIDVKAGYLHTCALKADGSVWCWGENSGNHEGQLGDDTTVFKPIPTRVAGGRKFSQIDLGWTHTIGIEQSGNAYCPANLVGYWNLDETSSPIASDLSGSGNHGNLINLNSTTAWVAGKIGGGLNISGANDYVEVHDSPALDIDLTQDHSWTFWVKPSDMSKAVGNIFSTQSSTTEYFAIRTENVGYDPNWNVTKGIAVGVFLGGFESEVSTDNSLVNNVWQHVAVTWEAAKPINQHIRIYVNGVDVTSAAGGSSGTTPASGTIHPTTTFIGASNVSGEDFDGVLDEPRVYNSLLSAADVAAIYASTTGACESGPSCAQPYEFDFVDKANVPISSVQTSSAVLTGLPAAGTAIVQGGGAEIENATTASGWKAAGISLPVNPGDTLNIRLTASNTAGKALAATVTIGEASADWVVTTVVENAYCSQEDITLHPICRANEGGPLALLHENTQASGSGALFVVADGNNVYSTSNTSEGLHAYTFNGTTLTLRDTDHAAASGSSAYSNLFVQDGIIHVLDNQYGLHAYSFNGTTLTRLASINMGLSGVEPTYEDGDVWAEGNYIYVATQTLGISALRFDSTTNSYTLIDSDGGNIESVGSDGRYIYAMDGSSIYAYTFDGTTLTQQPGSYNFGGEWPEDMWSDGKTIFVTTQNSGGLRALRYDGSAFTLIDSYDPAGGQAGSVWGDGHYVYLDAQGNGIVILSFDGSNLQIVDSMDPIGTSGATYAWGITGNGTNLFSGNGDKIIYALGGYACTSIDPDANCTVGCAIGMVHHWKLDENPVASPIKDDAGTNDGTVNGTITSVAGKVDNGLALTGTNYVDVGQVNELTGKSKFTISAWMKRNAAGNNVLITTQNPGNYTEYLGMQFYAGNLDLSVSNGSDSFARYALNDANWHHVVMVYDGTLTGNANRLKGYVDGEKVTLSFSGTTPATSSSVPHALLIGQADGLGSTGYVDELQIYNRPLSVNEVGLLYAGGQQNLSCPNTTCTYTAPNCPNIGDVCADGTINAGISPDGNEKMYAAAADLTGFNWDHTSGSVDTPLVNCTGTESTCTTGEGNTQLLASTDCSSVAGVQNCAAAKQCADSTVLGHSDWYLPSKNELSVLYTNRTAIGGFTNAPYWSSSEVASGTANTLNLTNNTSASTNKQPAQHIRCVRRESSGATSCPYTGLLGHWRLDETAGTTAYDSSGNNNNGTLTNMTPASDWVAGKVGNVLDFDGSNDHVIIADSATVDISGNGSMAAWVKRDTTGNWDAIMAKGDDNDERLNYGMEFSDVIEGDKLVCDLGNGTAISEILSTYTLSTGIWYHVACTWDGTTMRMYINGALHQTAPQTITPAGNTGSLRIGQWDNVDNFDGQIDDVRLYNRAISGSEVAQLYNGNSGCGGSAASTAPNYFVMTNGTKDGNDFTNLAGADAFCLSDLQANNWNGKSNVTLNSSTVKAWLCNATTCQNFDPGTNYTFARSGDTVGGGATFLTDASGLGPNNTDNWSTASYFNSTNIYWTGRNSTGGNFVGPNSPQANTCGSWNSTAGNGRSGSGNTITNARWSAADTGCGTSNRILCMVKPTTPVPGGSCTLPSTGYYIAEWGGSRIRRVDLSTGIITTFAGTGSPGHGGNGGPATAATLANPESIALDSQGNIYIIDMGSHQLRKVDAISGNISLVAGDPAGGSGFAGDGVLASTAKFNTPSGVAIDSSDNIYITDMYNQRIRKINAATGIISTVAGTGSAGYSGDGGAATSAKINNSGRVAFDSADNIYIAQGNNGSIRKVDKVTGIITSYVGTGSDGFAGDGGPAASAQVLVPVGMVFDAYDNLYFVDSLNQRIRKVTKATGIITTVAGNGSTGSSGDGGPALSASFNTPWGLSMDSSGNLYVADGGNHRIRKINMTTNIVSTVAGTGSSGGSGDGGAATSAKIDEPDDVFLVDVPLSIIVDTTPDTFSFANVTAATASTQYTAQSMTASVAKVSGFDGTLAAAVSGGGAEIRKSNAPASVWGATVNVTSGDILEVRTTASAIGGAKLTATVTLGSLATDWQVTTECTGPVGSCLPDMKVAANDAASWGNNNSGQLGDNSLTQRNSPVGVFGGPQFTQVAAGLADPGHSCGLKASGQVFCWGEGGSGQLGNNSTTDRDEPTVVLDITNFISVDVGGAHSCGLQASGHAWCWGMNSSGQLGIGSTVAKVRPTEITSQQFVQIALGLEHSCGLKADGKAYCWGKNQYGQLGDNSTTDRTLPVAVAGSHDFIQVDSGYQHSCGLTKPGEVWCWGNNVNGVLGDNTTTPSSVPVKVSTTENFIYLAVGGYHSCALKQDGAAWCWGNNANGGLGDNSTTASHAPVAVAGGLHFNRITAGGYQTCGLVSDVTGGIGYCWGANTNGTLGVGDTSQRLVPSAVSGSDRYAQLNAGTTHTLAIKGMPVALMGCGTAACPAGLVGYWMFDETTGTSAADTTTNANTGTLTNMTPASDWVAGKIAGGLDFDSTNDYVEVPNNAALNITNELTIAFWVKKASWTGGVDIISKTDGGGPGSWQYSVQTDNDEIGLFYCSGVNADCNGGINWARTTNANLTNAQWHHIAITYKKATNALVNVYVDGVAKTITQQDSLAQIVSSTSPLHIGWSQYAGSQTDATLDDVRIYNKVLTAPEIAAIYATPSAACGSGCSPAFTGTFNFADKIGVAINSPQNDNVTLTGFSGTLAANVYGGGATIRKNGTGLWGSSVDVIAGDVLNIKMDASPSTATAKAAVVRLGDVVYADWVVKTP